eukprot:scaffold23850_cov99-Isochrysis_galbana.AAC.2
MDTLPQKGARRDRVVETHARTSLALEMRVTGTKWRVVAVALVHPPTLLRRAVAAARAEQAGGDDVLPIRWEPSREVWFAQRPGDIAKPLEEATRRIGSEVAGVKGRRLPEDALAADEFVVELAPPAEERWQIPLNVDGEHLWRIGPGRGRGWRSRVLACRVPASRGSPGGRGTSFAPKALPRLATSTARFKGTELGDQPVDLLARASERGAPVKLDQNTLQSMLEDPPTRKGLGDLEEGVAHVLKEARLRESASQRDGVEALEKDGGERAGLRDGEVVGTLEQPPGSLSRRLRREVGVEVVHELGESDWGLAVPVRLYPREEAGEEVVVPLHEEGQLKHEVTDAGDELPPSRGDSIECGDEPNEGLAESKTSAGVGSRIGRLLERLDERQEDCPFPNIPIELLRLRWGRDPVLLPHCLLRQVGNAAVLRDTRANVLAVELLPDVPEGLEPHATLEDNHPLRDELHFVFPPEITVCVTLARRPRRRNEAATARTPGRILCAGRWRAVRPPVWIVMRAGSSIAPWPDG